MDINDETGLDTYNITDSDKIMINDYGTETKGDKYNIKGVTAGYLSSKIIDNYGNETYNISMIQAGLI